MFKNGSRKIVFSGLAALTLTLGGFMIGCSGNTDGGDATDTSGLGGEFVDSDSATGYIELDVVNEELSVSDTSGFRVFVKNSSGEGVPQMRVSCDTEAGLAILEPTTGTELTDENGQLSGVLGCEAPGSLEIGCRLAQGAYKRKFATIKCSGSVPAGFDGFAGATGGGLGGGVVTNDNGAVTVTAIDFVDSVAGDGTHAIDVIQSLCGTDCATTPGECTAEPFTDTFVHIKLQNNTNQNLNCSSLRYSVPEGTGASTSTLNSGSISFVGVASPFVPPGEEAELYALFMDATVAPSGYGVTVVGGKKFYATGAAPLNSDFGFRNVTFRVSCSNEAGDEITLTSAVGISLDSFDHC